MSISGSSATQKVVKTLIEKIKETDCSESKNQLINTLLPVIRPIVGKYYGNYHDKEEALNYILAKVFQKINYIDINKSVISYIKFIANNYCIDEYRKKIKRRNTITYQSNELLDSMFTKQEVKTELTEQDYKEVYRYVTNNDTFVTELLYDLERTKLSLDKLSKKYQIPEEEIVKVSDNFLGKKLLKAIKSLERDT